MTQQDISALTTMLADMQTQLQAEFNKINQRLDAHDARFDRLEARFERLEDDTRIGFDRVNTTLDGIAGDSTRTTPSASRLQCRSLVMRTGSLQPRPSSK